MKSPIWPRSAALPGAAAGHAVVALATLLAAQAILRSSPPENPGPLLARQQAFESARLRLDHARARTDTNDLAVVHDFCRLAYELATIQPKDSERERITQLAIAAAKASLSNNPAAAPTHYYLALNLGELARTKSLGALQIVPRIRDSLESARVLDESLDHAGPDRTLGLLYLEAPGWPTSIGSRDKAKAHFLRALQIAPEYPGNHLGLAEALLRWRDLDEARARLRSLDAVWTNARARLSGPRWQSNWLEWTTRRDKLAQRLSQTAR